MCESAVARTPQYVIMWSLIALSYDSTEEHTIIYAGKSVLFLPFNSALGCPNDNLARVLELTDFPKQFNIIAGTVPNSLLLHSDLFLVFG
jgi:hypothetical protein